jgi:hypothetical protein
MHNSEKVKFQWQNLLIKITMGNCPFATPWLRRSSVLYIRKKKNVLKNNKFSDIENIISKIGA